MKVEKASKTGFCFGVKRAVSLLEQVARERGGVETLGALVHNDQVLERLARLGVRVAGSVADIRGNVVVTSSHGVSPHVEEAIKARNISIISAACPFVRRAQIAARRLADSGFRVIVYGDAGHPEVKGILGWAGDTGLATTDETALAELAAYRRIGILSQTTQVPARFTGFVKILIDNALNRDAEIRIVDTICHDIRERQEAALGLARRVDLMLVVGGANSANTHHLVELCATAARTYQIETAADIQCAWLRGQARVGVTAGASTAEATVDEVVARLQASGQETQG